MAGGGTVHVRIRRYAPDVDEAPRYESFEVPYEPDMRILDVLDHIHETFAVDFGYRWLCGVKRCGSCAVMVNGTPRLACWEPAEMEMTIEPLANHEVVRDLVISREGYEAALASISPLLVRREPYAGFPEPLSASAMEPAVHLRDCIQCLACQAACPVLAVPGSGFAGPAVLVALAELALDPRDGADRAAIADRVAGVWSCVTCYRCEQVCPAEIPIVSEAIEPLRRKTTARGDGDGAHHARAFLENVKEHGRVNAPRLLMQTQGIGPGTLRRAARLATRGKVDVLGEMLDRAAPGADAVRDTLDAAAEDDA